MATVATLRSCTFWLPAIVAIAGGCARPSPPPAAHALDVPPTSPSASASPGTEADPGRHSADADDKTIKIRFHVLDQELRRDPKSGRETFHTTLELVAATQPPQRVTIGRLNEPGCRLAFDAAELDESAKVRGGLVCYYAGYGDYVLVTEDGAGHAIVSTYGQSELVIGNENPPREHERVVGRLAIAPGSRLVFELVEPDAGVLP